MKSISQFSYLILLFASVFIVLPLYLWFFDDVWNSSWALQYKELLLFAGILLVFCGVWIFLNLLKSEAWKNLTSKNVVQAIIKNLILQMSFWFGLGICFRAFFLFVR